MKITLEIPDGMRIGEAIWQGIAGKLSKELGEVFDDEEIARELSDIEDQDLFNLLKNI